MLVSLELFITYYIRLREGLKKKYGNFHKGEGGGANPFQFFFSKKGVFKMHFKLWPHIMSMLLYAD